MPLVAHPVRSLWGSQPRCARCVCEWLHRKWDGAYSTLRNTVDQLKEHPQADRHKFKKMLPKVTGHRNREEVCEDTIAEMKMEDLQGILKEDVESDLRCASLA